VRTEIKIKKKAKEIGFDLVGITDLKPSIYQKEYKSSIEKTPNRNIKYLKETEKGRLFPGIRFPWAKSVVVLGINYWQGDFPSPKKGEVRISRYALGKDYHIVLSEKLSLLSKFIKEETKIIKTKYYTDTGPLMEKELAERAGLGWIGKNKLLITEEFGSWVFLGEILVDIELTTDEYAENKCGDCNICLAACPNKALVKPYTLDLEKCSAFQTVKKKGALPSWFPTNNNDYIFGCDICQEVCPFNSNAKITKIKDFMPDKRIINPSLDYLQNLSEDEFNSLFSQTPINWAGRDVFMRNLETFKKSCPTLL
jgi:epoxyqueuosine reductase